MQAICHSICGFTDAFLEIRHFSNYSFLAIIFNYMRFYCTYVSHILHSLLCFIYSNLTLLVQASPCSCHHVGIAGEIPCSLEKHQGFKNHSRDSGMLRAPKCHQSPQPALSGCRNMAVEVTTRPAKPVVCFWAPMLPNTLWWCLWLGCSECLCIRSSYWPSPNVLSKAMRAKALQSLQRLLRSEYCHPTAQEL